MKDINEYNDAVSEYELFSFLYDRVISREISTFSALKAFAPAVIQNKRAFPAVMRAFELIKRLNWGFFAGISPAAHKKIWRELVIPDKVFPDAGDLKRTLSISNLYVAMLDIHGYTKFCQDSRKNLSMLHILDRAINLEIRDICAQCCAVCQRERGDEIVVVAASATDALMSALCIIDYFAKTNVVADPRISTQRSGETAALPAFEVSAGITGGNTSVPLIITEQGNLSGFLLNTGARLQTRANELSPVESRIMLSKQVQMSFVKENAVEKCSLYKNDAVYFLDTGNIEFKGVLLPTCEAVYRKEDRYKEQVSEDLNRLFNSIKENLWEQRILTDLIGLLYKAVQVMPPFTVTPSEPVNGMQTLNNGSFQQICRMILKHYLNDEDYPAAVELLRRIIEIMQLIPRFDRLILDYARGVTGKYEQLLEEFQASIDREVDQKANQVFTEANFKAFLAAKNAVNVYEKLRAMGRKSPELTKKKTLWYYLIKANQEKMAMTIHSGKK
ncbi:MAG: hypothetical protein LBD08_02580 [Treponema sp.]|nr:hypothetical protein [Treponema sp.]